MPTSLPPSFPFPKSTAALTGARMFSASTSGGSPSASGMGLPASGYTPGYGGVPNVPNPINTAGQAVSGNMSNLSKIYQMASGINAFNTQAQLQDLMAKIPNYQQLIMQNSGNIMSGLKGQLPQDVIIQMLQRGAERGIQSGMAPGSANANAAYLRALGLNSLQLQQQSHNNLQQTIQNTPRAEPFNIGSMLVTPDQMQSASMAQSIYNSAPNPKAAADAAKAAVGSGMKQLSNGAWVPNVKVPGGSLGDKVRMLGGDVGSTYWTTGSGPFQDPSQIANNYNNWLKSVNTSGNRVIGGGANPSWTPAGEAGYQSAGIPRSSNMMEYNLPDYSSPGSGYTGNTGYNPGPNWQDMDWGVSYDIPSYTSGNWQDVDWGVGYNLPTGSATGSYLGGFFDDSMDFGSILGSGFGD